jgi:hypothetical protein
MSEHAFVQLPARAGSADMDDLIKAMSVPDLNKGDIFVSMSEMEFYEPGAEHGVRPLPVKSRD